MGGDSKMSGDSKSMICWNGGISFLNSLAKEK
jgi:hypothetical protein